VNVRNGRKEAYSMLRTAMQKAAQLRLMEKEKNKSPSFAMRISVRIKKIVWSMLADGKSFSEAEINDMVNLIAFWSNIFLIVISDITYKYSVQIMLKNDDSSC
jgi:hypothetical protein